MKAQTKSWGGAHALKWRGSESVKVPSTSNSTAAAESYLRNALHKASESKVKLREEIASTFELWEVWDVLVRIQSHLGL